MVARAENRRKRANPLPTALLRQRHLDVVDALLQVNRRRLAVPVVFVDERRLLRIPLHSRMCPFRRLNLAAIQLNRRAVLVPLPDIRHRLVATTSIGARETSHADPCAAVDLALARNPRLKRHDTVVPRHIRALGKPEMPRIDRRLRNILPQNVAFRIRHAPTHLRLRDV